MNDATALRLECPLDTALDFDAIASKSGELLFDMGVLPRDSAINTYCATIEDSNMMKCQKYVDKEAFYAQIKAECQGKRTCMFHDLKAHISIPVTMYPDYKQLYSLKLSLYEQLFRHTAVNDMKVE